MIRERGNPALHFLDRYGGIPVISVLGRLKPRRPFPSKIQTIGLFKTGAIGDTVLMSAVVSDLRQAFPGATVIFFAGHSNVEMAGMIDGADRVVEVPAKNFLSGIKAIRSVPVDVMVDFGQWARLGALLSLFSRAGYTIGFRTAGQHRHHGYDHTVDHSAKVHELENFRRLIRPLGVKTTHSPRVRAPEKIQKVNGSYTVFHLWPGGLRSNIKEWPAENWLRLAQDFVGWGMDVVLTGGASDHLRNEQLIANLTPSVGRQVRNVAGKSLGETCAILRGARLLVSVNTGVMHLAAALGVPLVALHGPTSSKRWGPVSTNAIIIDAPLSGCAYLHLGWEYPAKPPKCMESIRYEVVRDACRAALDEQITLHRQGPLRPRRGETDEAVRHD